MKMTGDYKPTTHKFVVVINKKVPVGKAMNAIGHMTAGLVGAYEKSAHTGNAHGNDTNQDTDSHQAQAIIAAMRFDDYVDADGGIHQSISDNPFIVLQADNSNQLRTLRNALLAAGLVFTDFTSTMTEGTYADQRTRTRQTPEAELEYFGVCVFGEAEQLNALTKKFSLWR